MSDSATVTVYALTRAEIQEIAVEAARCALAGNAPAALNEIPTAEAMKLCRFRTPRAFRAAMQARGVRQIRRGWWRRPAIERAMGGRAA